MEERTYEKSVAELLALGHELHQIPAHKFDPEQMRRLSKALGDPWRQFQCILVAGTNGKGSTSSTLASILRAAGYRTGLYTSPHLVRINERIRVDGRNISDDDFAKSYDWVSTVAAGMVATGDLPQMPSFFETVTAMAFHHFADIGVEVAVLEVGMGGRLDATNIVDPVLSIITDIDLDHQKYLGDTIAEIAREKAGIMRRGVPVVMLPQHPQANDVLGKTAIEVGADAISAAHNVAPVSPGSEELVQQTTTRMRFRMSVLDKEIEVDSPLVGRHQLRNLALAVTAAETLARRGFHITAADIERGIRETRWRGRFEVRDATAERPTVVFDVAHNPAGAWALRSVLTERLGERPRILVFGVMRDKAIRDIAQILFPTAEKLVVTTTAHNPRAAATAELAALAKEMGVDVVETADVSEALAAAYALAKQMPAGTSSAPVVVVSGSIYIVGEAMALLNK